MFNYIKISDYQRKVNVGYKISKDTLTIQDIYLVMPESGVPTDTYCLYLKDATESSKY